MTRLLAWLSAIRWRAVGAAAAAIVLVAIPWWGPALLSHLSFFRVRNVEISGLRYVQPEDMLKRLRLDTTTSVWSDLGELEHRVEMHPQIKSATIDRELPGTLVVHVTENPPIASSRARKACVRSIRMVAFCRSIRAESRSICLCWRERIRRSSFARERPKRESCTLR